MANDDVKPDDKPKEGAVPAVDLQPAIDALDKRMKEHLQAFVRTQPAEPPPPAPAPPLDPLGQVIDQHVRPQLQAAQFRAEAAEDKADFYSSPEWREFEGLFTKEEATAYRKELEGTFASMVKANKALPRADILQYIRGRDIDKFVERRQTKRQTQVEAAQAQVTVGEGGGRRDIGLPANTDWHDLNEKDPDKFNKAVAGMSF